MLLNHRQDRPEQGLLIEEQISWEFHMKAQQPTARLGMASEGIQVTA